LAFFRNTFIMPFACFPFWLYSGCVFVGGALFYAKHSTLLHCRRKRNKSNKQRTTRRPIALVYHCRYTRAPTAYTQFPYCSVIVPFLFRPYSHFFCRFFCYCLCCQLPPHVYLRLWCYNNLCLSWWLPSNATVRLLLCFLQKTLRESHSSTSAMDMGPWEWDLS